MPTTTDRFHFARPFLAALLATSLMTLPTLAQETPTSQPAAQPTLQPKVDLPAVAEVIARYVEAIGGEEAIRKHTSRKTTGMVRIPMQGMHGSMTSYASVPNKMLVVMTLPEMGEVRQGFDGQVSWNINPMMGPAIDNMDDTEVKKKLRLAELDFYADINYAARFPTMEITEQMEFGGVTCWAVKCVSLDETESTHYFDCETGLLKGFKAEVDTGMGMMKAVTVFEEYKEFDGVKVATKQTMEMMGMTAMILSTTEVEWNKVDPAIFTLPQEIQALLPEEEESKDKPEGEGGG